MRLVHLIAVACGRTQRIRFVPALGALTRAPLLLALKPVLLCQAPVPAVVCVRAHVCVCVDIFCLHLCSAFTCTYVWHGLITRSHTATRFHAVTLSLSLRPVPRQKRIEADLADVIDVTLFQYLSHHQLLRILVDMRLLRVKRSPAD